MSEGDIAEVVAAATGQFTAEKITKDEIPVPPLGSWVQVPQEDGSTVYGVVCQAEMAPYDENRRTIALKRSLETLQKEMPHIWKLLRTTFQVAVCAHRTRGGHLRQSLPPSPVRLHQFVSTCGAEFVREIKAPYDYLRILVDIRIPDVPIDEVLVAVLRGVAESHGNEQEIVSAGRALSRLLGDDHERLQSILRRAV